MVLDVDFTSDVILGDDTPPPPPPSTKKRPPRVKTRSDTSPVCRELEPVYSLSRPQMGPGGLGPASYLEVLTRGLKEARAKQYAEKVAQYDRFFNGRVT